MVILNLGNAAPGANNIVDGLLKFQALRKNVTLIGAINGIEGFINDKF